VVPPAGLDGAAVAAAIDVGLVGSSGRRRGRPTADMLVQRRDGRFVVHRDYVERLGDCAFERGKKRIARLITGIRAPGSRKYD